MNSKKLLIKKLKRWKKQEKQLEERHKKLTELKEKKEEITEETLKKLNEEELKVEIDILTNAADKMHCVFNED